eukprot:TRINITY_DN2347_c0_g2_i1.p1 TRINITY_DN2347_c0_g2~~TRINITY_DN2347_c0_g2_i1.p1  ORF type:complete len:238 (+),score=70.39 TRINITY_DN2347_c0_g2_i1:55-714(+)
MEALLARMTVGEMQELIQGKDPSMRVVDLLSGGGPDRPVSSESARRKSSAPTNPDGGFVSKSPHFDISETGLTLKKTGNDGKWNTVRIRPGSSPGTRKYYEFHLKKLKNGVNHQVVLGLTQESFPKDNFLGTTAFSWGYGAKYGHAYHKAADMPFAEQARQGDVIGILMAWPQMLVYKNGKKLGKACDLHATGDGLIYGAVSLLHEGDTVVVKFPPPPP